jgi:hypothetical protein
MIRLFLTLCKCFQHTKKNNDYELFLAYTENAKQDSFSCPVPSCGSTGNFNKDGTYSRTLICYTNNSVIRYHITIPRLECHSCQHSHAVLPPIIIPYSPFSFHFILSLLYDYITHNYSTIADLCLRYDISASSLYRIYHRFLNDRQLMLGMMEASTSQALELIQLLKDSHFHIIDSRLQDFHMKTQVSFLQARCNFRLKQHDQLRTSNTSP